MLHFREFDFFSIRPDIFQVRVFYLQKGLFTALVEKKINSKRSLYGISDAIYPQQGRELLMHTDSGWSRSSWTVIAVGLD